MVWQVVEINSDGYYLCKFRGFLLIKEGDKEISRISLDSVSVLLITSRATILSKSIITTLSSQNIPLVLCDHNYLPTSITLPYGNHYRFKQNVEAQRSASKALNKNLWKNIVKQKIVNQADVLERYDRVELENNRLRALALKVKSGDKENHEAQAAKYYWKKMFDASFKRNKKGGDDLNIALNYGYTILRSACARAVVSAGLLPLFGMSHSNMYNPFCLADDLIEPFRPFIDSWVLLLALEENAIELTPNVKIQLSKILTRNVYYGNEKTILGNAIQFMAQDIAKSYITKTIQIKVCKYSDE